MKKLLLSYSVPLSALAAIIIATIVIVFSPDYTVTEQLIDEITDQQAADLWALTADDCYPEEIYDEEELTCYIECDTDSECLAIEAQINEQAESIGEDFFGGRDEPLSEFDAEDANLIISYEVIGDKIIASDIPDVTGNLEDWQTRTSVHQEVWSTFTRLIPTNQRPDIIEFNLFTDGEDGTMASVNQIEGDHTKWALNIDIADASGQSKRSELQYTLIHEFGHVMTLREGQLDLDEELLATESDDDFDELFERRKELCGAKLFLEEGCSAKDSYVNQFYEKFWMEITNEEQEDANPDNFVTDYAATDIGEDITESWTAFVLKDKPGDDTIVNEKILFFYEYPELISLRRFIRGRL